MTWGFSDRLAEEKDLDPKHPLKSLFRMALRQKWVFLAVFVLAGLSTLLALVQPILYREVVNDVAGVFLSKKPASHPLDGLRNLFGGFIEGTCDLGQIQTTDMEIDGGRCRGSVTEKQLDMVETRSCLNQMGGKAVSQRMHAGRFGNAGQLFCSIKH